MTTKTLIAMLLTMFAIVLMTAGLIAAQQTDPQVKILEEMLSLRREVVSQQGIMVSQKNVIALQDQLIDTYENELANLKAKCAEK